MVGVLVERVLPPALADGADQRQLTRMHVRVAVIGLVRILGRVVGVHQVGHGAPVDQEVSGMVRLGLYVQAAPRLRRRGRRARGHPYRVRHLRQGLLVNSGIHLGPLEQILAVVTAPGVVIGGLRQPEIAFPPVRLRGKVRGMVAGCAVGGDVGRKHNDGAVQAHLDLEVALRAAVVGVSARR